jgi:prophage tail gpP-like protein
MTLSLMVNGTKFREAISIDVHRSLGELCGYFNVRCSIGLGSFLPFGVGSAAQIVTESNRPVLTGFVEQIEVEQDTGSHDIAISGRDRTCDLVDGYAPSGDKRRWKGPIAFDRIAKTVLADAGLSAILLVNEAGALQDITDKELVSFENSTTVFDFLDTYARRLQVILITNGDGNIVMIRASKATLQGKLIRNIIDKGINILASRLTVNRAYRYNKYVVNSQVPVTFSDSDPSEVINHLGEAVDKDIRPSRILMIDSEEPMTSDVARKRAEFEAAIRLGQSLTYSAVVQGHEVSPGNPWQINRLIAVTDDLCAISDTLLVKEVNFRYDLTTGSTTEIVATYKNAYAPEPITPTPTEPAVRFSDRGA